MKKALREDKQTWFNKLTRRLFDAVYDVRVKLHEKIHKKDNLQKKEKGIAQRKVNNLIFYCILMAWPVIQFCIFYIGVNLNSVLMAFQTYNSNTFKFEWYGFKNFEVVFNDIATNASIAEYFMNSMLYFGVGILSTVLALLFSYYIFKKMAGYKFFRLVLYIPSIISPIVIAIIFMHFIEKVVPGYLWLWTGSKYPTMDTESQKRFWLIFYNLLLSFGVNVLMYSSSMSSIDDSVIESAQLDGAKPIREFFSIVLPLIYPTVATFLAVSIAGIFTNQYNLFSLYGDSAPSELQNLGYFLYLKTYFAVVEGSMESAFVIPATWGLVFTLVAAPITLFARWALNKFGPSTN